MRSDRSNVWLVAEDSDDDFFFFQRASSRLSSPPKLQRANNGIEAQRYLDGEGSFANRDAYPLPSVVVSDLKMPLMDGLELMNWFRKRAKEMGISFVLLTSSDAQSDRDRASEAGVDEYLVKPGSFPDLVKAVIGIRERHTIDSRRGIETSNMRDGG
jgi:CheY-like chemotaxis protein